MRIRLFLATLAFCASTMFVSGCGSSTSLNLTCGSYLSKSASDQRKIAVEYLKQVAGKNNPGSFTIVATEATLHSYCSSHQDVVVSHISV